MQFQRMVGIYQISVPLDSDLTVFEEVMKTELFPKVELGNQTRGGIVTAQSLLKGESSSSVHHYLWLVH